MSRQWTNAQKDAIWVRGKTVLISAAAGSGKTSVLTERIIQRLVDPNDKTDLSRLLVVTFTRSAAAELKSRIAQALSDALAENPDRQDLSEQLLKLGNAQISTIDSFFQKLVRSNFEKQGLTANFRIADDAEIRPLAISVLERVIADFYEKYQAPTEDEGLTSLQSNRFAQALDHLMPNRSDGALNDVLLNFLNDFSSYSEGIELLKQNADSLIQSTESDFMNSTYGRYLYDFYYPLFECFANDLEEHDKAIATDPAMYQRCMGLLSSDLLYCKKVCKALQTHEYETIQSVVNSFYKGSFPSIKKEIKTPEVQSYQNWRTQFWDRGVKKLKEAFSYSPLEIDTQVRETAEFCSVLYDFFKEYQERLLQEKKARGILEYNDIRTMVYRLLHDPNGNFSEFADSIAKEYDEVYIDEYQDVDSVQDEIFATIGRDRRFMVGDIKQSIYSFRGSEPTIFSGYRKKLPMLGTKDAEHSEGISIFMSENFRCDQSIIDFTNTVCSFLFSACEESVGYRPEDDLKRSKPILENAPGGYPFPVQFTVFEKKPQKSKNEDEEEDTAYNQEAGWIADEIARLLREETLANGELIQPSNIKILVRDRKHGKGVTKALQERAIPISSASAIDFLSDAALIALLNLLRAIDNPYRDLPLSEFLLSPFGGFTLEELAKIRQSVDVQTALFDAMQTARDTADIDPQLSKKVSDTLQWLQAWREQASVLPADRLLRLLYLDHRLVALSTSPSFLMLYDQSRIYQRSSWCGLYGFLQHVERLMDGKPISSAGFAKAENAVTVMTIHQSKGLEFPIVFLMSCGAGFNDQDSRDSLTFHKKTGCATKLYQPSAAEHQNTILRDATTLALKQEQHEEAIRTLYVALTRAGERLYVTGTLGSNREDAQNAAACVKKGNRGMILACNSYLAWLLAVKHHCESNGLKFPCIFQYIPYEKPNDIDISAEEKEAFEHAKNTVPVSKAAYEYADVIKRHRAEPNSLQILQGLPTKSAASKLSQNFLDLLTDTTNIDASLNAQIEMMSAKAPSFDRLLLQKEAPTAAEIGTATHAFFEFCDFDRFIQNGTEAEKQRLIAQGFLRKESASMVRDDFVEAFRSSCVMQWIQTAEKVYREQKFSMMIPMSSLTENAELADALGQHELYVQGSIDLLLEMPNRELILVDYKTDRVSLKERKDRALLTDRMKAAHQAQLSHYAKAVEQLFGKKPNRICLYLFDLGDIIEI
ncbi:MAG: hypothetical protein E7637_01760 [Ruminococcaceae bacterium]|nr:hypothetical protein [Oscillospiraceae bacterium]